MFENIPSKLFFVFVFIGIITTVPPLNAEVHPRCVTPQGDNIVPIDVNTGVLLGPNEFPMKAAVSVVFINKNPFEFEYQWQIVSQDLESEIIQDALRIFLGRLPTDPPAEEEAETDPTDTGTARAFAAPNGCQALPEPLRASCQEVRDIQDQRIAQQQQFDKKKADLDQAQEHLDSFNRLILQGITDQASCSAVATQADQIESALQTLLSLDALRGLMDSMDALATQMTPHAAEFEELDCELSTQEAKAACVEVKATAVSTTQGLDQLTQNIDQTLQDYTDHQAEYETLARRVLSVRESPQAFVEIRPLPNRSKPTAHSINILRKTLDSGESETLTVGKITVGQSRFSISAGLGISFIEDSTFGRQSNPDGDAVFSVLETSDSTTHGVVQLNACIQCGSKRGFLWSLGMGLGIEDSEPEIHFFTGPSFGLINNQFLVTLAFHQRDVTEPANGFRIGRKIPEGVNEPLPTTERSDQGLLLTLTYKIR